MNKILKGTLIGGGSLVLGIVTYVIGYLRGAENQARVMIGSTQAETLQGKEKEDFVKKCVLDNFERRLFSSTHVSLTESAIEKLAESYAEFLEKRIKGGVSTEEEKKEEKA